MQYSGEPVSTANDTSVKTGAKKIRDKTKEVVTSAGEQAANGTYQKGSNNLKENIKQKE